MHLKVHSVTVTSERKNYDGSVSKQATCVVGDQNGSANLFARNEQLDVIKEGSVITIRNANSKVFNEHMRLEVDKWGKIEASHEKVDKVNTENNLSDVEYELVPQNRRY